MIYFLILVGIYGLKVLLKMHWIASVVTGILLFAMLPKHRKQYRRMQEENNRFLEATEYLDSLLYAFSKDEKVERALTDVEAALMDGKMKEKVREALEHLRMTFDDSDVMKDALGIIENAYPCSRIHTAHDFIVHVEQYGGRIEHPIGLLLSDKKRWENRILAAMKERKKMFTDIVMSISASLVICGIILYLPVMNMDISQNAVCQVLTVVAIFLDDMIFLRAQRFLSVDWLKLDVTTSKEDGKRMQEYHSYEENKAVRLSILFAAPFAVGTFVCLYLGKELWTLGFLLLMTLMLNQHRVGHHLLRKNLIKSIKCAFPNWLMDIVLLLQSENVQMAIRKSMLQAQPVLSGAITEMTEQMEMQPESAAPFHAFLQEFAIPEVHSAMSMLFSVSMGQSNQADKQLKELIDRNLQMLDITEKERINNLGSGMYLLFLAPVLTASFKLVVDMGIFMLSFLTSAGI